MEHKPEKSKRKDAKYKSEKDRKKFRQEVLKELGAIINTDVWDLLTKMQKNLLLAAQNFMSVGISDEALGCFRDFYIQEKGEGPHGP